MRYTTTAPMTKEQFYARIVIKNGQLLDKNAINMEYVEQWLKNE